jgi:hypothetical protein
MISRTHLRTLVESVLLEGIKDDQRELVERFREHADKIGPLSNRAIIWLYSRFGSRATNPMPEDMFVKALEALTKYEPRSDALAQKYAQSVKFKDELDKSYPVKPWQNLSDIAKIEPDDMLRIISIADSTKQRINVNRSKTFSEDLVGKVGPWEIYEPSSRENSCNIVGLNKESGKPNTDWCTVRTDASNLFYNYAAQYNLFTLVHQGDVPARQKWISIAMNDDGTVEYEGTPGEQPTVDGMNDAMDEGGLRRVLGADFDGVMEILRERVRSHSGVSLARAKIRDAARDAQSFNYIMQGISKTEAASLKQQVAKAPGISSEIAQLLADDPEWLVRHMLAQNKDAPADIIEKLSQDENVEVRQRIAKNEATPPEILTRLTKDKDVVQYAVMNPRVPPETLASLADVSFLDRMLNRTDRDLLKAVGKNPSTPVQSLQKLAKNSDYYIRLGVAQNRAAPASLLRQLADDDEPSVRTSVAYNPSTDISIVRELAVDKDGSVSMTAREVLRKRGLSEGRLRNLIRRML